MAMSDCEKCWETPCACGLGYREWTEAQLVAHIAMLQGVLVRKRADATAALARDHEADA